MSQPATLRSSSSSRFAVPDFIIGGAPKCGTSSLHFILEAHPRIQMPKDEIHFFDVDDPLNHPDFLWNGGRRGRWPAFAPPPSAPAHWYETRFPPRVEDGLLGEDSTTYLHSPLAARRLARHLPDVKLIFALRDPVERAASQYRHLVESGRATHPLPQALSHHPTILRWSSYEEALRTYFAVFPRRQIHLFVFERFVENPQREVDAVLDFLGCDRLDLDRIETRYNVSRHPLHLPSYLWVNRALGLLPDRRYAAHFGYRPGPAARAGEAMRRLLLRAAGYVLLRGRRPVPVPDDVKTFLHDHLRERNAGLSDLCDIDFAAYWKTLQ